MKATKSQNLNLLRKWRKMKGLNYETVDKNLAWPQGLAQKYELSGLVKTPCCNLSKLIEIYQVPISELHQAVIFERNKLSRSNTE